MRKNKNSKKYLLVIIHSCFNENYLYDSLEKLLKDWDFESIEELNNEYYDNYVIFEISNIYGKGVIENEQ